MLGLKTSSCAPPSLIQVSEKKKKKKSKEKRRISQPTIPLTQLPSSSPHPDLLSLIRQNSLHHIHIVQLAGTRIDSLQQLIHLLIAHLLPQVRQDIAELADADEACEVLVEDLEAPAVVFGFAGVAETAGPV